MSRPELVVEVAGPVAPRRVLFAGLGNVFLGDDGFGVAVAQRLAAEPCPAWARLADYGIRGVHLAYDLMAGYDATVLIDVDCRGDAPGTVRLLEISAADRAQRRADAGPVLVDPHGMQPQRVLDLLDSCGSAPGRVLLVGCEPLDLSERMGLSPPVAAAVATAAALVRELWAAGHAALSGAEPLPAELLAAEPASPVAAGAAAALDEETASLLGEETEGVRV
ncbi:hydrogenase maturation protease [Catellatospora sp. NPDC049609]|uniref:hydrogenase maturation protease n=1 Tax=Catellatospora sp. NPDC049609 TaxID=3155505 RepID=UPI0034214319